jgi:predicted esterase YcpF (UPF0227 family)
VTSAIVYLHGLNSGPQTVKGRLLAQAAASLRPAPRFHMPQLPHWPEAALDSVRSWIDGNVEDRSALTLVGSSLGGFYATCLAERTGARAVVINPAVRPYAALESFLGPQRNLYSGEHWELTREHLRQLLALRPERITRPGRYLLLVRSGDELLDWRDAVRYDAGAWQYVGGGGDHGWTGFEAMVPTVLQWSAGS